MPRFFHIEYYRKFLSCVEEIKTPQNQCTVFVYVFVVAKNSTDCRKFMNVSQNNCIGNVDFFLFIVVIQLFKPLFFFNNI